MNGALIFLARQPWRAAVGNDSGGTVAAKARSRQARWPYLMVPTLYLLMIALGPLFSWWALVEDGHGPDANIGYGLGFLWTAAWGLPWSLPSAMNPPDSDVTGMVIYIACGLINVVLISVFMVWVRRRVAREYHPRDGRDAPEPTASKP
jgi:hypothetical protein